MDETKICTRCNTTKPLDNFIGKTGKSTNRCSKCRGYDIERLNKPDAREKHNKLQREKKYYVKYRNKKKEEKENEKKIEK